MKVIVEPTPEEKVIAPVSEEATSSSIYESMVQRAECCVDHLCGCSCNHSGC
jgi:hypothetical protein